MKEKKGKEKVLFALLAVAVIILASFAVITQFQLNDLASSKISKQEQLSVKVFADVYEGTVPFSVNFSAIVTNNIGDVKYQWDFGNGDTSEEMKPSTNYEINGTYICTLSATDEEGQKASDSINIIAKDNDPPSVSMSLSSKNPSRPFIIGTMIIWSKWADHFDGRRLRRIIEILFNSSSLLNMEGFITCKATAVDYEGDEIISYKWILEPYPYTFLATQVKPRYVFETKENEFTFPLLYTFGPAERKFDVTVIVTDSKGNTNSISDQFVVQKSGPETTVNAFKQIYNNFRITIWNIILAPNIPTSLKESIADYLWSLAEKAPLPILEAYLKIIAFSLLFKWNLLSFKDPSAVVVRFADVFTSFIEKYPALAEPAEKVLDFLENLVINLGVDFISELALPAIQDVRELWGISNYIPDISDPNPGDGDKVYNQNYPEVSVKVNDFDEAPGDWFNVTIHGLYVQNETWSYTQSGVFSANLTGLLPADEKIEWHVEVQDHLGRTAKETYSFYV